MTTAIGWVPQPGPQRQFIECPIQDAFYGGAKGGGKTDALLGDAQLRAYRYGRNWRGLLCRISFPELRQIIRRSQELYLPLGWRYNGASHEWRAPNGASLVLGYLWDVEDALKYQGESFTWVGFDELTQWPEPNPIDALWGMTRSAHGIPCVHRSTGNPGGVGHDWVKRRYRLSKREVKPCKPFEYAPLEERPDLKIQCVFIPSRLEDNQFLARDATYEAGLAAAGGIELFRSWRQGDWDAAVGAYFQSFTPDLEIGRDQWDEEKREWFPRWLSCDWGYQHRSAVYWLAWDGARVTVYRELVVRQMGESMLVETIRKMTPPEEKLNGFVLSPDAWAKRRDEKTIGEEMARMCAEVGLPMPERADTDRIGGWRLMHEMFTHKTLRFTEDCPEAIAEVRIVPRDQKNLEDVDPADGKWDCADAVRYGCKAHSRIVVAPPASEQIRAVAEPYAKAGDLQSAMMMNMISRSRQSTGKAFAVANVRPAETYWDRRRRHNR